MEEVLKFHSDFIREVPKTMAVVGSLERITKEDLKKYGDLEILNPEELLGF